jgi:rhodanese-related sulfurtransferase
MSELIHVEALHDQPQEGGPVVIDVRSEEEYAAGHIPGALHIPADEVATRLNEIPKDRPVVPY